MLSIDSESSKRSNTNNGKVPTKWQFMKNPKWKSQEKKMLAWKLMKKLKLLSRRRNLPSWKSRLRFSREPIFVANRNSLRNRGLFGSILGAYFYH